MAADVPPLEPPGCRVTSHGLFAVGNMSVNVSAELPNSGVLVLPRITASVVRRRSTTAESKSGTQSTNAEQPRAVRNPSVSSRSFTQIGTPCNEPGSSPAANLRSHSAAAASAPSASGVTNALSCESSSLIRRNEASTSSTDEISLASKYHLALLVRRQKH